MNKFTVLFLLTFTYATNLNAQANYQLIYQSDLSTIMGAELMASTNFLFRQAERQYLKPVLFKKPDKKIRNGILNGFYRFTKTIVIDVTRDNFLKIFQHEVFGHGARLREYGYTKNKYYVGFPFGGGTAFYGIAPENRIKTLEEEIMIRIGGVESTTVLSNKIRNNWLENEEINLNEAYLYVKSFMGLNRYIRITDITDVELSNYLEGEFLRAGFYSRIGVMLIQ